MVALDGTVTITYSALFKIFLLENPCGKKGRRCRPCGGRIPPGSTWYHAYRIFEDCHGVQTSGKPEFPVCQTCVVGWGLKW